MSDTEEDPHRLDAGVALQRKHDAERNDWKQRVRDEQAALAAKCTALHGFINSAAFYGVADHEKGLLNSQLGHMQAYLNILNQRIDFHNQDT